VLIASSAKLPPPLKRFAPRDTFGVAMTPKVQIVFPPNGANLELSRAAGQALDPIAIKITGGTPPLNVLLNGMPLPGKKNTRTLFFEPDGPGFVRLTVTDATGAADSVVVRLQ
jgi:penicillin-binding protein 1C